MQVNAEIRYVQGTSASRRLRHQGQTPAIVYGNEAAPLMIVVNHKDLFYALKKEAFHSSVLDLIIDGHSNPVLLRDYQMHPYKPQVLHVDFQRINPDQEITLSVPLHYLDADKSQAVKIGGAVVNYVQNDIEITCLPANLPKFINVDLSKLENGSSVHAKDLTLPEGVKLSIQSEHENSVLITLSNVN